MTELRELKTQLMRMAYALEQMVKTSSAVDAFRTCLACQTRLNPRAAEKCEVCGRYMLAKDPLPASDEGE